MPIAPLTARHRLARTAAVLTLAWLLLCIGAPSRAEPLPELIARSKPSIVGVGTLIPGLKPDGRFTGTGFVVGDGNLVATNMHVAEAVKAAGHQSAVMLPRGRSIEFRPARVVAESPRHDLALLRFGGSALPALPLGEAAAVREGDSVAVVGYPIGTVLGLHASTHAAIIASISPLAIPAGNASELSAARIAALRDPFDVYQLDMIVYPGHSGSPVLLQRTGQVIGVVSGAVVKDVKEDPLAQPSAIAYAIPVNHLRALLDGLPAVPAGTGPEREAGSLTR